MQLMCVGLVNLLLSYCTAPDYLLLDGDIRRE